MSERIGTGTGTGTGGVLALVAVAAGCGGLVAFEEQGSDEASSTVAVASSTSGVAASTASGSGGGGGEGEGGSPPACTSLAWAGEPVFISARDGGRARAPSLVVVDDRVAVAFLDDGASSTLASVSVDAWGSWPPEVGERQAHHPVPPGAPTVTSVGEPGGFAFLAAEPGGALTVGQAVPGGSSARSLGGLAGEPRILVRGALLRGSPYLLGWASGGSLSIAQLPALGSGEPMWIDNFACADRPIAADADRFGEVFMVASSNDSPFDDCLDPDLPGPPVVVQLRGLDQRGNVVSEDVVEGLDPVTHVQLAAREGGGWLATREEGSAFMVVRPIDASGSIVGAGLSYGIDGGQDFALSGWREGLALCVAGWWPPQSTAIALQIFDADFGHVAYIDEAAPNDWLDDVGHPDLVASRDGRSFLLAFETREEVARIGVLRADCVP